VDESEEGEEGLKIEPISGRDCLCCFFLVTRSKFFLVGGLKPVSGDNLSKNTLGFMSIASWVSISISSSGSTITLAPRLSFSNSSTMSSLSRIFLVSSSTSLFFFIDFRSFLPPLFFFGFGLTPSHPSAGAFSLLPDSLNPSPLNFFLVSSPSPLSSTISFSSLSFISSFSSFSSSLSCSCSPLSAFKNFFCKEERGVLLCFFELLGPLPISSSSFFSSPFFSSPSKEAFKLPAALKESI